MYFYQFLQPKVFKELFNLVMKDEIQTWRGILDFINISASLLQISCKTLSCFYVTSFCTVPNYFKTTEKSLFTAVTVAHKACLGRRLMQIACHALLCSMRLEGVIYAQRCSWFNARKYQNVSMKSHLLMVLDPSPIHIKYSLRIRTFS